VVIDASHRRVGNERLAPQPASAINRRRAARLPA